MPIFRLSSRLEFPPVNLSETNGLLCIGGDLSIERLLLAYSSGIFPWFSDDEPILWWSPDPRLVLFPEDIKISKSLKKKLNKPYFKVTIDTAFRDVINACADIRTHNSEETWLGDTMIQAYIKLYEEGFAHSIECWKNDTLAGGLYGVSLGRCFFGESMFTLVTDASKTALVYLARHLSKMNFDLIDCQVKTDHLKSMGAVEVPRNQFIKKLNQSLLKPSITGRWEF